MTQSECIFIYCQVLECSLTVTLEKAPMPALEDMVLDDTGVTSRTGSFEAYDFSRQNFKVVGIFRVKIQTDQRFTLDTVCIYLSSHSGKNNKKLVKYRLNQTKKTLFPMFFFVLSTRISFPFCIMIHKSRTRNN